MAIEDFFDKWCSILSQPAPGDGDQDLGGAPVREPHQPVQVGVPCLVRELGASADPAGGKAAETKLVRVYLSPADLLVAVTTEDVLLVTGPGPQRRLAVTGTVDANGLGRILAVDCVEQPV